MTIEDSAATTTTTTNEHPQVVTAEEEEEQPEEEKEERSALRDNIERKGKNAYYFAHAKTANGPKWDGKVEPKLLTTSSSVSSSASMSKLSLMAKSNITNYAFLDDGTKVKIYVNLPGVGDCEDDKITIDFTERSLCLMVKDYSIPSPLAIKKKQNEEQPQPQQDGEKKEENKGQLIVDTAPQPPETTTVKEEIMEECSRKEDRCLTFAQLYGDIEKATFKKKPDKVIITLKKKNDSKKWNSIIA